MPRRLDDDQHGLCKQRRLLVSMGVLGIQRRRGNFVSSMSRRSGLHSRKHASTQQRHNWPFLAFSAAHEANAIGSEWLHDVSSAATQAIQMLVGGPMPRRCSIGLCKRSRFECRRLRRVRGGLVREQWRVHPVRRRFVGLFISHRRSDRRCRSNGFAGRAGQQADVFADSWWPQKCCVGWPPFHRISGLRSILHSAAEVV
mmetsp:Transcript_169722/g.544676  ORF Transcript_169722/g.544676 Transcript_169722/m.544676 type:complete len:200 (+) Transcript_169722:1654-2253(+)